MGSPRSCGSRPCSMAARPTMTATALGVLVLGETIPPLGLLGLVFVLVGLLLQGRALGASREETAPEPAREGRQINARPAVSVAA